MIFYESMRLSGTGELSEARQEDGGGGRVSVLSRVSGFSKGAAPGGLDFNELCGGLGLVKAVRFKVHRACLAFGARELFIGSYQGNGVLGSVHA